MPPEAYQPEGNPFGHFEQFSAPSLVFECNASEVLGGFARLGVLAPVSQCLQHRIGRSRLYAVPSNRTGDEQTCPCLAAAKGAAYRATASVHSWPRWGNGCWDGVSQSVAVR